jgi:hypothetical protein
MSLAVQRWPTKATSAGRPMAARAWPMNWSDKTMAGVCSASAR